MVRICLKLAGFEDSVVTLKAILGVLQVPGRLQSGTPGPRLAPNARIPL